MKARAAQSGTCAEERTRALVPNWSRAGRGRACLNPPDPLCRPDVLRGAGLSTHGREHPTAVRGWPADPARDEWIATGHDHAAGRCRPAYDPRALGARARSPRPTVWLLRFDERRRRVWGWDPLPVA